MGSPHTRGKLVLQRKLASFKSNKICEKKERFIMAKLLVDFELSHGQEKVTQGNIVIVDINPGKSNLHDQVRKLIAEQFNCSAGIISIKEIKMNN
jgi:SepF-like predicted cell division protein (DUF552 family)